jgi:tRNA nucleotidyltransferase (CCA-adding enzyme)
VIKRLGGPRRRTARGAARAEIGAGDITRRFKRSLPAATHVLLKNVGRLARDQGSRAYLVGGIVRDIAIGHPVTDLDITIEGNAEAVAREFARSVGGTLKGRSEFGTCKVETSAFGTIDFATTRKETYSRPGALPATEASGIGPDLERRDFALNAMAIRLDPTVYGRLLDPCGGVEDLARGKLRVMHPRSFLDDPTRVLRGVRFAARYGFTFESRTLKLLGECIEHGGLESISGKRVYRELQLICMEERSGEGLRLLEKYAIFDRATSAKGDRRGRHLVWRRLPAAVREVETAAGADLSARWIPWFASCFLGLCARDARALVSHFNLPRGVTRTCLFVAADCRRVSRRLIGADSAHAYRVVALLKPIPIEGLADLCAMAPPRVRALVASYLAAWRHVKPGLTGADLAAMGLGESPLVGKLLADVTRLKLAGRLCSAEAELAYVRTRIARRRRD